MLDTYPQSIVQSAQPKAIPVTKGLPLVGSLPQMIKNPFGFLMQARNTYGDIYNLNLGISKMLILNNPRQMQHIMVDNVQNYRKGGGMWDAVRAMLGNGLVVKPGAGDFQNCHIWQFQPAANYIFCCAFVPDS